MGDVRITVVEDLPPETGPITVDPDSQLDNVHAMAMMAKKPRTSAAVVIECIARALCRRLSVHPRTMVDGASLEH
jgi:hypothetical protein